MTDDDHRLSIDMKESEMKSLATTIGVLVALVGSSWAAENYTLYYIHSIGDGTLVVNSCLLPERFAVKTDQETVIIRLDGKAGKLSDLKVGQWVKLYPRDGGYDPENQWIAKIEVDSEPMKPVDETQAATAEVVVRGTVVTKAKGPGQGGWPTLTVSDVFKTPKDVKIGSCPRGGHPIAIHGNIQSYPRNDIRVPADRLPAQR